VRALAKFKIPRLTSGYSTLHRDRNPPITDVQSLYEFMQRPGRCELEKKAESHRIAYGLACQSCRNFLG
jgi:hypothetical protein